MLAWLGGGADAPSATPEAAPVDVSDAVTSTKQLPSSEEAVAAEPTGSTAAVAAAAASAAAAAASAAAAAAVDTKKGSAAGKKHAGFEEASVPGQDEEGEGRRRGTGRSKTGRSQSARYMSPKGKMSARYRKMAEKDRQAELSEDEHVRDKMVTARASARTTARKAALHPLVTSRPAPQRWRKRPDDWKHEENSGPGTEALTHTLWDMVSAAGLPGAPQQQSYIKYGSQRELTEKERAYQLEKQLESRERKQLAKAKAEVKERKAMQKLAENEKQLEWYKRQKDRQKAGLQQGERQEIQSRLYASPPLRAEGRVYG